MIESTVTAAQMGGITPTGGDASLGGLGGDAFLELLVAQLRYQNPMEPSDGTQLLQQTAQFTQVETLKALAETQQQLMNVSRFSLAAGLTGRTVAAIGADGVEVSGLVDSLRFSTAGPELHVGDDWVPVDNVTRVHTGGPTDRPAPTHGSGETEGTTTP